MRLVNLLRRAISWPATVREDGHVPWLVNPTADSPRMQLPTEVAPDLDDTEHACRRTRVDDPYRISHL